MEEKIRKDSILKFDCLCKNMLLIVC